MEVSGLKPEYITKLKQAKQNGSLIPVVELAVRNRWPFWIVSNRQIRDYLIEDMTYHKFRRKYKDLIANAPGDDCKGRTIEKKIWICWLQGMENAPDLVKACYKSVQKHFDDYEINLVTSAYLRDYIDIPAYILEKWEKGIIPNTQFTDYIRTALLVEHGGIWLDATVLCTGRALIDRIISNDFFVYQMLMGGSGRIVCSSWLIASCAGNPLLSLALRILDEFWKTENGIPMYLFYHVILTICKERYSNVWERMPVYDNVTPHLMVRELNKRFDKDRFSELCRLSSFHKLNYKLEFSAREDTLYSMLVKGGPEEA